MSKATVISVGLIILGFIFECLYLTIDNQFLDAKFWVSGIACIIAGTIGLWLFTILPWMDKIKNK